MPKAKNSREAALDKLSGHTQVIGLNDLIEILNSPKRLGWLKFYSGLMTGVGATLGAAIIVVLLAVAVKYLGGVPWIGNLLHEISNAAHT